jgi:murein DD-endopeptidase MepM/ murein hydrolase activator NlpD
LTPSRPRIITYAIVGLLAATALTFVEPLPPRTAAEVLVDAGAPLALVERVDSVGRGETLGEVIERGGAADPLILAALRGAPGLDSRRIPAGMRVTFAAFPTDSIPREITLHLAIDRLLRITRGDSGWIAREETLPWVVDTMVVRGEISTNLYEALASAAAVMPSGARTELAWDVADIFEFRIDMSRDLQVGDAFAVLVEREQGPQGAVRPGRVLAATFTNGGKTIEAIRHEKEGARPAYYDQEGRSLHANFLRAPLAFRRISSVFGLRRHPVLKTWRRHQGTDYAANSGTPVRAIGEGVVIFAGRKGGYGNAIDIRHANGFVSRYGHLRGFARGVRAGTRVGIGQTIGYVGMTGLATGPHLHFEILVGGVQRNPRTALASKSGKPLPEADRPEFETLRAQYLALLSGGPVVAHNAH